MAKIESILLGDSSPYKTTVLYNNAGLQYTKYSSSISYNRSATSIIKENTDSNYKKTLRLNLPASANAYGWAFIQISNTSSTIDADFCVAHLNNLSNGQGAAYTYPPSTYLFISNTTNLMYSIPSSILNCSMIMNINPNSAYGQAWLVLDMSKCTVTGKRYVGIGGFEPSSSPVTQSWYCDYIAFLEKK